MFIWVALFIFVIIFIIPVIRILWRIRTDFKSGCNNDEIACNFIKDEVAKTKEEYDLVCGMTSPDVLVKAFSDPKVSRRLKQIKVNLVFGPSVVCEKETFDRFLEIIRWNNIKVYRYNCEPKQHFRVYDLDYAYIEDRHGCGVKNRSYKIFKNAHVVAEVRNKFNSIFEKAKVIPDVSVLNRMDTVAAALEASTCQPGL